MLQRIIQLTIQLFQVLFGYVTVSAVINLAIKILTLGHFNLHIIVLLIFVWLLVSVRPQPQSRYPFAFQVKLRFR